MMEKKKRFAKIYCDALLYRIEEIVTTETEEERFSELNELLSDGEIDAQAVYECLLEAFLKKYNEDIFTAADFRRLAVRVYFTNRRAFRNFLYDSQHFLDGEDYLALGYITEAEFNETFEKYLKTGNHGSWSCGSITID